MSTSEVRDAALVEMSGVEKRFGAAGSAAATDVLRGIDLRVEAGEQVGIVGPSGSGKSTVLHLLGGLELASAGQVHFEGQDLAHMKPDKRAQLRLHHIGFVFQLHHLLPQCTALENILVPTLGWHDPRERAAAPARAHDLLERVGLGARGDHRPGQLSGGECQRVALVRSLIGRPKLLLADEPTGSLDAQGAEQIVELLIETCREENAALVMVTHAEGLAERMQRVLELRLGQLQARQSAS